ncbi:MAG: phenylalanine--tRNA ligase subunit alpha [bacterium]
MKEQLEALRSATLRDIDQISDEQSLEELRIAVFGRKGALTNALKELGAVDPAERPVIGALANTVKQDLQAALDSKKQSFSVNTSVAAVHTDVTQPGKRQLLGTIHPIAQVIQEVKSVFSSLGFVHEEGPEVEWDYYNFEALNLPKHHPARDTQASFYFTEEMLLRTQTSPVQVRVMEKQEPPVRMYSIGKCYRRDYDLTHTPMFHQFEGLVIDKHITMSDLKGILTYAMRALFGEKTQVRFRPHHFPFTEPSIEPDVTCSICWGKGCRTCKYSGWVEMGGAGMVSPHVLRKVGYDPYALSGFAFGFGIERPVMIKYRLNDMRLLFENDIRFLQQFT